MIVQILGKKRKGKKDFHLISEDEFGFNIQCIDGGGFLYINNLKEIRWVDGGNKVCLDPRPVGEIKFWKFEIVKITKAKKREPVEYDVYPC